MITENIIIKLLTSNIIKNDEKQNILLRALTGRGIISLSATQETRVKFLVALAIFFLTIYIE